MARRMSLAAVSFALLLAVFLTAQIAGSASAHKPIFGSGGGTIDSALEIPDALVSYAIYAQFDASDPQIQYYEFEVLAGDLLNFQVLIPAIDGHEQFAPSSLLIGPGLPSPTVEASAIIDEFSIQLAAGQGVLLWSYDGADNVEEFEPFTQTKFWERQDAELTVPINGTYYLAIMVPDGDFDAGGEGKYVLAPGKEEDFGLIDYVAIPLDWVLARVFWEQNPILYLAPTFAVVAFGLGAFQYRIRSGRSLESTSLVGKVALYVGLVGGLLMIGTGVNQILLIGTSSHLSESALNAVVIAIQAGAIALGLASIRLTLAFVLPRAWTSMVVPVVLTFLALMLGAGFLIGPAMFLTACAVQLAVGARRLRDGSLQVT